MTNKKALTVVWTLDEAVALVKLMQDRMWGIGYHIALGGGVLNHGHSDRDLDLYVLPFGNKYVPVSSALAVLHNVMDYEISIGNDTRYSPVVFFQCRDRYSYKGKRVDVFVVRG